MSPTDKPFFQARLQRDKRFRGTSELSHVPPTIADASSLAPRLDQAVTNGSSIAFEAEFDGKRCLFLADAHMPAVEAAIGRLLVERGETRLRLDAIKLSHHGSAKNLTRTFLAKVDCHTFLVSTDGSIFGHPDAEAIDAVVQSARPARLVFNYQSETTARWAEPRLQHEQAFTALFPSARGEGVAVDLI